MGEHKGYPVILGGDHAAFELEHAGMDPKMRPDWPLPSFDAKDWAEDFCKRFKVVRRAADGMLISDPGDEGLMTTWFANALMRGFDEQTARVDPLLIGLIESAKSLLNGIDTGLVHLDSPADETLENTMRRLRVAVAKAEGR